MTKEQKIIKYLSSRKTPATQAEIAKGAKVNPNTLRKVLGGFIWRRIRGTESLKTQDCKPVIHCDRYKKPGRYSVA